MAKLRDVASLIRSKNAGPFYLTLDILFPDRETYQKVAGAKVITGELISSLYSIPAGKIKIVEYPQGNGIKVTIDRHVGSGDFEDTDLYGTQQHVPLFDVEVPGHLLEEGVDNP